MHLLMHDKYNDYFVLFYENIIQILLVLLK